MGISVSVLLLDGVFDTGLSTVLDTFDVANALSASTSRTKTPLFDVQKIGFGKRIKTSQGLIANVAAARSSPRPDIVLVPALGAKTPEAILERLERRDVREAGALLRAWSAAGTRVAAACTATFVLAHAGLLDEQPATTTWWLAPTMRTRFPRVRLDDSRMVVEAPGIVTVGAALAHVDLVLWLVRRRSPSIARATAGHMNIDERHSQASFILPDFVAHSDPLVDKFERWARRNLAAFSLPSAARSVGASERTIERRLQLVLGKSPVSYVQDLRVELAVHQLKTTDASIDEVATLVGYRDGATLRALLRKKIGRGVRELRRA